MLRLLLAAVITTDVRRVTRLVVTLKLADVAPAGTMMLAGTLATFGLLLTKVITAPPEGAGALNVTVPVEARPPLTLVGLRVNELSTGKSDGVDVGVGVGVDPATDVDVGVGVGVDFVVDVEVGVAVGVDDAAPSHSNALTFELL